MNLSLIKIFTTILVLVIIIYLVKTDKENCKLYWRIIFIAYIIVILYDFIVKGYIKNVSSLISYYAEIAKPIFIIIALLICLIIKIKRKK